MSAAQYRIVSPAGGDVEDGSADVEVARRGAHPRPVGRKHAARSVRPIPRSTEPEPFTVRVTLADGNAIELSSLGMMRTQLLAELRDGRGDAAAEAAAGGGRGRDIRRNGRG